MIPVNDLKKENLKKKEYLKGFKRHTKRINRLDAEIEVLRSMKMFPSTNNDGMPHGSGKSDLSSYAASLLEKEDELHQKGVLQMMSYQNIMEHINKLEDEDERDILFYRYIKGLQWWQIANEMHFSESWIYELHGRALKNLQIDE